MEGKVVLVIAAHPDDPEFGCGATVAKYIKEGAKVYYVVCTAGDRGSRHHQINSQELVDKRHKEQENAAKIIGVSETYFFEHEDGNLIADLQLKEQIVRIIRKLKPDMIFTHDPSWFYKIREDHAAVNHNDHRQTGIATLDAVYPLSRDLASFPTHASEGLTPHTVEEVYLFNFDDPNFFVDVTESLETKIKAILAHGSQIDDPKKTREWVEKRATEIGEKSEHQYAEGFTKLILR